MEISITQAVGSGRNKFFENQIIKMLSVIAFCFQLSIILFILYFMSLKRDKNFDEKLEKVGKRLKIFSFLAYPIFYEWVGMGILSFFMGILEFNWPPILLSLCILAFLIDPIIWKSVYRKTKVEEEISYKLSFLLNFSHLPLLLFYYLALFL